MTLNHRHRDVEWLAVDRDRYGVVLDCIGTSHTITAEVSGTFVAIELDMILCSTLLGTLDQCDRVAFLRNSELLCHETIRMKS